MPLIKKEDITLDTIDLVSCCKCSCSDKDEHYKTVHFFTYDWLYESAYRNPEDAMEKYGNYYALLTPDFSVYTDMPVARQIDSVFKNRWCGAYWQSLGMKIIPTVSWAGESSYEFCFDGIEQGSVVAVSTYHREEWKDLFMRGFKKMMEMIKPSAVICYGEKFPGMTGNIKFISPYNHSELCKKLGTEEYMRRLEKGDLYPS